MKRLAIVLVVLTLSSLTVQARLGQSIAEVENQYGKPTVAPFNVEYLYRDYGDTQAWYEKNGIKFLVIFKDGKSQYESITKKDSSDSLTHSEVVAFLSANSGGATWLAPSAGNSATHWMRDDGGASAVLSDDQKKLTVRITSGGSKGF